MKRVLRYLVSRKYRNQCKESARRRDLESAYSVLMRHAGAPRLEVETEVSADVLGKLIEKVENVWFRLGEDDAHWSVITNEKFRKTNISEHLDDFFAMGESDVARLEAALNRVGSTLSSINSVMDFGCGVGRLSIPLARRCRQVLGVDISSAHLREAKANIQCKSIENLDLALIRSVSSIRELQEFELVYSLLVLQHNSPPVMLEILKALCSRVSKNGYLYLQTQTYQTGYSYDSGSDLKNTSTEMAMHVLPQDVFLQTIQDAGLTVLEVAEDGSAGNLDFKSQVVLAKRRL